MRERERVCVCEREREREREREIGLTLGSSFFQLAVLVVVDDCLQVRNQFRTGHLENLKNQEKHHANCCVYACECVHFNQCIVCMSDF